MNSQRRTFLFATLLLVLMPAVFGQASPPKVATATIAGKDLKVDYYSPSMRGRKIFGNLVRWNEIWCPGANWATAITSPVSIQIGSLKLDKGSYALWVIPNENNFELIINSDSKAFHLSHDPATDLGRMKMNLKTLDKAVEQLTFEIRPVGGNRATLALIWENTEASVPITVSE